MFSFYWYKNHKWRQILHTGSLRVTLDPSQIKIWISCAIKRTRGKNPLEVTYVFGRQQTFEKPSGTGHMTHERSLRCARRAAESECGAHNEPYDTKVLLLVGPKFTSEPSRVICDGSSSRVATHAESSPRFISSALRWLPLCATLCATLWHFCLMLTPSNSKSHTALIKKQKTKRNAAITALCTAAEQIGRGLCLHFSLHPVPPRTAWRLKVRSISVHVLLLHDSASKCRHRPLAARRTKAATRLAAEYNGRFHRHVNEQNAHRDSQPRGKVASATGRRFSCRPLHYMQLQLQSALSMHLR